jgi:hypothetical protein
MTDKGVAISGYPTYFFSMFEDAHLTLKAAQEHNLTRRELLSVSVSSGSMTLHQSHLSWPKLLAESSTKAAFHSSRQTLDGGALNSVRLVQEFAIEGDIELSLAIGVPSPIRLGSKMLVSEEIGPAPQRLPKKTGLFDISENLPG